MIDVNQRKIGAIIAYVSIFVSAGISLVYTPYMLRVLGESEHGLFALVNSVVAYFTLMDFGFGNAIIRFSAKYIEKKDKAKEGKLLGMFFLIYAILGFIVLILGFVLSANIGIIFNRNFTEGELRLTKVLMQIATVNIALSFIFRIFNASIQAHQKFIFSKIAQLVKHILNPLLMVIILINGYRSIGMMIGFLVLNIVFLIVEAIYFFTRIKVRIRFAINFKVLKEISVYSFFIFLDLIVDRINWSTDQLLLGIIKGPANVSRYAIASNINTNYRLIASAISGVFLAEITGMVERGESTKLLSDRFIKVGRIQWIVLSLVLSGFIIYGRPFVRMWAGANYEESYYIAIILIAPVTIPLIQTIALTILRAKNLHKFRSLLYLGVSIINIIISIPLIKLYGGIGAALGTGIALLIANGIIMNIYYKKKLKLDIKAFWKNIILMSLGLIIPMILGLFIKEVIIITGWWRLLINIAIYFVIFSASYWIISFNEYEKNTVIGPIKKVFSRGK